MKNRIKYISLLLWLPFMVSCEDINAGGEEAKNPEIEVTFTSAVYEYGADTEWAGNESIGIFMKKNKAEDLSDGNIVNGTANRRFTAAADGTLSPASEEEAFIYQQDGSKVDFVAYYPYRTTVSGGTLAIGSAGDNSEVLYSNNATGKYKGKASVKLNFGRTTSKIIMNIANGVGVSEDDLETIEVKVNGMYTGGILNLATGNVEYTGSPETITATVSEAGKKAELVVMPTVSTPAAGRKIIFSAASGVSQIYDFAADHKFEMGKQYTLDVTFSISGIEVTISDITDWVVEEETGNAS